MGEVSRNPFVANTVSIAIRIAAIMPIGKIDQKRRGKPYFLRFPFAPFRRRCVRSDYSKNRCDFTNTGASDQLQHPVEQLPPEPRLELGVLGTLVL